MTGCSPLLGFPLEVGLPRNCQHLFGAFSVSYIILPLQWYQVSRTLLLGGNLTAFSGSCLLGILDGPFSTLGVSSRGRDCRALRTNDVSRRMGLLLLPPSLAQANPDDSTTSN